MELVERRIENRVEYALREGRLAILPESIQRDRLTQWIVNFDNFGRKPQRDDYWRGSNDEYGKIVIAPMVQSTLIPNISFYFASLFYIGRLWATSEQSIQTIQRALSPENLQRTAQKNIEWLRKLIIESDPSAGDLYQQLIPEALTEILDSVSQQHRSKLTKAQEYWRYWHYEVNELSSLTERASQEYNEYRYRGDNRRERFGDFSFVLPPSLIALSTFSFQTKRLFQTLKDEDIQFKNLSFSAPVQNNNWLALLSQIMLSERGREALYRLLREWESIQNKQIKLAKEQQNAPIIGEIQSRLLRDFNGKDPFEQYKALASLPDENLRALWDMCKLPDNKMFFYAKKWLDSLETIPSFYSSEFPYKESFTTEELASFAASVDSTIKRKWVSTSKSFGETDEQFAQRMLENEWVVAVVKGATYPARSKKGNQKWSYISFHEWLSRLIEVLNQKSYNFTVPNINRLEKLWQLAVDDKLYNASW